MGAPLASVWVEYTFGDAAGQSLPVPTQLKDIPPGRWPYPGPPWWRGPAAHPSALTVSVFVLRVNALILELREQAAADVGDVPSTLAFALDTALTLHVRGAAALNTLDAPPTDGDLVACAATPDAPLAYVWSAVDVWAADGGPAVQWPESHPPMWWTAPDTQPFIDVLLARDDAAVPPRAMPASRAVVPTPAAQRRWGMQGGLMSEPVVGTTRRHPAPEPEYHQAKAGAGAGTERGGGPAAPPTRSEIPDGLAQGVAHGLAHKLRMMMCAGRRYTNMVASMLRAAKAYLAECLAAGHPTSHAASRRAAVCGLGGALTVVRHALYASLTGGYPYARHRAPFMTRVALDAVFNAPSCFDTLLAWLAEPDHDRAVTAIMTEFIHSQGPFVATWYAAATPPPNVHSFYASAIAAMDTWRASHAAQAWTPRAALRCAEASTWVFAACRGWASRAPPSRNEPRHLQLQDAIALAARGGARGDTTWLPNDVPYIRLVFQDDGDREMLMPKGVYDFLAAHVNQHQWVAWALDDPVSDEDDLVEDVAIHARTEQAAAFDMRKFVRSAFDATGSSAGAGGGVSTDSESDDGLDIPGGASPSHGPGVSSAHGMVTERPWYTLTGASATQVVLSTARRLIRRADGIGITRRRAVEFAATALMACGVVLPVNTPPSVLDVQLPRRNSIVHRRKRAGKRDAIAQAVGRAEAASIREELGEMDDWHTTELGTPAGTPTSGVSDDDDDYVADGSGSDSDSGSDAKSGDGDGDDDIPGEEVDAKPKANSGRRRQGRAQVHIAPVPLGTAKEIDDGVRAAWDQVRRQVPRDKLGTWFDVAHTNGKISIARTLMKGVLKGTSPEGRSLFTQLVALCVKWRWPADARTRRTAFAGLLGTMIRAMRTHAWEAKHAPWAALTPEQRAVVDAEHAAAADGDARDVAAYVNIHALLHESRHRPDDEVVASHVATMSGRAIMCALVIEAAIDEAARCRIVPVSNAVWVPQEAAVRERYTTTLANGTRHVVMPKRAFQVLVCFRCRAIRSPCVTKLVSSYEDRQKAGPSMVGTLPCPSCADIPELRHGCTTCDGQGHCMECGTRVAAAYVTKGCSGRCRAALTPLDLRRAVLHMDGAVYSWCLTCGVLFEGPTQTGSCWACNAQWLLLPFAERRLRCMTGQEASAVVRGGGFRGAAFMSPRARPRFCTVCGDPVEGDAAQFFWMAQPAADGQPLGPNAPATMRLAWLCWKHNLSAVRSMLALVGCPTPAQITAAATASLGTHQANMTASRLKGRGRGNHGVLPTWMRAASGMLPARKESDATRPFVTADPPELREAQDRVLAGARMATKAWATAPGADGIMTDVMRTAHKLVSASATGGDLATSRRNGAGAGAGAGAGTARRGGHGRKPSTPARGRKRGTKRQVRFAPPDEPSDTAAAPRVRFADPPKRVRGDTDGDGDPV